MWFQLVVLTYSQYNSTYYYGYNIAYSSCILPCAGPMTITPAPHSPKLSASWLTLTPYCSASLCSACRM